MIKKQIIDYLLSKSGNSGLSLEIFLKNDKVIHKQDVFFNIENESNTGITF